MQIAVKLLQNSDININNWADNNLFLLLPQKSKVCLSGLVADKAEAG